jgi:uncharacterized membrane protein
MMTANRELMSRARELLKGRWGIAVGANAIYLLLIILVQGIPHIGWIAGLIIGGPLILGWTSFFLSFSRRQAVQAARIFEGFNYFAQALTAYLLMILFILLWTLLFIIPGIVAYLSYSLTFFIMADDPKLDGREAIRKSKTMMQGHRWRLFCLYWRFFGWFLLGVISFGIGFLWILPYLKTALAGFYNELLREAEPAAKIESNPPTYEI